MRNPLRRRRDSDVQRARRMKPKDKRLIENFLPPEGVPIKFRVASLGARFGAQMLDILLTVLFVSALLFALGLTNLFSGEALLALFTLLFFALRVPYYVITEILWNGQTLGKKLLGIRVISGDGRSLSPHAVTVRNLMKEMEIFVPGVYLFAAPALSWQEQLLVVIWIMILLAVPLLNRRRQRLGDIIANTYVVEIPKPVLLPDLASAPQTEALAEYSFMPHHLDHYGRFELQTLETLLQVDTSRMDSRAQYRHRATLQKVTASIVKRIEFTDTIPKGDERSFLETFYRTQRAYLENRKLFGDAREDKFHRESEGA
jgi:uncharacterized RDD family membrane protein YckC